MNIVIKKESPVFRFMKKNGCFIDIYTVKDGVATIFELKDNKLNANDFAQTILYWYGARKFENIKVDKLIMVATEKISDELECLLDEINKDSIHYFTMEIKTFEDFNVDTKDFDPVPEI